MLYLLREQTWIARKYPNREQREIDDAWLVLCRSLEKFLEATFGKASKKLSDDLQSRRAAAEAAGTSVTWWPKVGKVEPSPDLSAALKVYSDKLTLPSYQEAVERGSGGRPAAYWANSITLAMKDHIHGKAKPLWATVSSLLRCAPQIEGLSMEPGKLRQRLVLSQRENKTKRRFKPTVKEHAYEIRRLYATWDKTGPCPSLIIASEFRSATADSSFSEESTSKIIEELHRKYKTEER
jgi:hypothetical protein